MKIFRKAWAIYGLLVFFLLWVVFLPFYYVAFLVFPKKWRRGVIWFSHHVYTRLFFGLTLVRVRVEGLENLDLTRPCILVSNHRSPLDFMINAVAYPGIYKYLAKKELVRVPLFGFIVRKMCVLVDRSSTASRAASMKFLRQTLAEGYSVFLYPEGTRNLSAEPLLPFQKGAFRIALESGNPIAVQTIVGVERVSGRGAALDLCPGTVRVVWSKPLETSGLGMRDLPALEQKVREAMLEILDKTALQLSK